jgi:hypothetical protein
VPPALREAPKENHGYSGLKGAPSTGVRLKRRIQGVFRKSCERTIYDKAGEAARKRFNFIESPGLCADAGS